MRFQRYAGLLLLAFAVTAFIIGCGPRQTSTSPSQSGAGATTSRDMAFKIEETSSPAGVDSREPELYSMPDGRVILSWVERVADKRYALRFSVREGANWSAPRTVSEGENWFVNWADFPSVISTGNDSMAAHWLVKSGPGTYSYDVNISLSKDGGRSWGKPIVPHTDRTQTEHGFVSLIRLSDGSLGASWVDGRKLAGVNVDEDHGPMPESMMLRYARINAEGKVSDEATLDDRICECCQTSAAMTAEGAIVVYRNRSETEVRDIYYVREEQGRWSEPRPVHVDGWEIAACPVNGPSVAADGQRVAVAWYTEANDKPTVRLAFSRDAGRTFGAPIQVDDEPPVGRVDVVMLSDGSAIVTWLAGTAEKGAIKARRISASGTLGAVATIAETNIARSSGFPRMARSGDEVVLAWTEFGKPSRVRTALINLFR
ncbi:MAG TPA: sialidase family protein [Pyrinomonadaceae bacterium]|nr:sialidase family protein [Pyrinomonadaceae bacterium]